MFGWLSTLEPPTNLSGTALITYLLLDVFLVIVLARLVGNGVSRIGQPRVVGEILAGILLGPTVLGPTLSQVIAPLEVRPSLNALATLGLILFTFIAGLEFNQDKVKGKVRQALLLALLAVGIPGLLGFPIGHLLHDSVFAGRAGDDLLPFALFLGAALSVTAFPVMAHILMGRGELDTQMGILSMATSGFISVFMFQFFGFSAAVASDSNFSDLFWNGFWVVTFALASVFVVRPLLGRILSKANDGAVDGTAMAVIFGGMVVFGMVTHVLGMTALVGGFMWGLIFPKNLQLRRGIADKVRETALIFLLPIFFAISGFSTDLRLLSFESLPAVGLMLAGAIGGKFLAAVPGRFFGLSWREVGVFGALINTRGMLVLLVGLIGLQLEVITPLMYVVIVVVALVTNFLTLPLMNFFYNPHRKPLLAKETAAR